MPEVIVGIEGIIVVSGYHEVALSIAVKVSGSKVIGVRHRQAMFPKFDIVQIVFHFKDHDVPIGIRSDYLRARAALEFIHDDGGNEVVSQVCG